VDQYAVQKLSQQENRQESKPKTTKQKQAKNTQPQQIYKQHKRQSIRCRQNLLSHVVEFHKRQFTQTSQTLHIVLLSLVSAVFFYIDLNGLSVMGHVLSQTEKGSQKLLLPVDIQLFKNLSMSKSCFDTPFTSASTAVFEELFS